MTECLIKSFIKSKRYNEMASGRYGFTSEIVRDALRAMEERKSILDALRSHIAQGAKQVKPGQKDFIIAPNTPC
jgi:putative addiction module CopG family antidote